MKRILALFMSLVIVMSCVVYTSDHKVYAMTESELQAEIDRLEKEMQAAKNNLDGISDEKEDEKEKLDALNTQLKAATDKVEAIQSQIDIIDSDLKVLNEEINDLDAEINDIETDIAKNEKDLVEVQSSIDDTSYLLEQQLRASYMQNDDSVLQILMGADSLASFLTRLEMMKRVSETQKGVIDDFKEKATSLEELKQKLSDDKADLNSKLETVQTKKNETTSKKSDLESKKNEYDSSVSDLSSQTQEINDYIDSLDTKSDAYNEYLKELEENHEAADAEMDRVIQQYIEDTKLPQVDDDSDADVATKPSDYNTSDSWAWPMGSNSSFYISSYYGNRDASISGWAFHGGIDITGAIYGAPIYATRSGVVGTAQSWDNGGYGIYVMLDHQDGFLSIYGHCSKIVVSKGQYVEKGALIAYAGSTGNSTGPHLHFEIRKDGEKVNPLNYVKKP